LIIPDGSPTPTLLEVRPAEVQCLISEIGRDGQKYQKSCTGSIPGASLYQLYCIVSLLNCTSTKWRSNTTLHFAMNATWS
jgi:hypothetical protein